MKNYKNVTNNYLLIVEGEELELNLFEDIFKTIFSDCEVSKYINGIKVENDSFEIKTSDSKERFILVKPKHNMLSQILLDVNGDPESIEPYLYFIDEDIIDYEFRYVFYIFDIDYTTDSDLLCAFSLFNDPTDRGFLLVSSPCIEALSDFCSQSFKLEKKEGKRISNVYKPLVQKQVDKMAKCNTSTFIKQNSFTLFRHSLYKNRVLFNDCDIIKPYYLFQQTKAFFPYSDEKKYYFPIITSFVYILIAILFKFDTREKPFECLDGFLKRFSFHDTQKDIIVRKSPFLKD